MKKKRKTSALNISKDKIASLLIAIKDAGNILPQKKVTAGFDGFVDTIVNVIKKKQASKPPALFKTIKEFGNYIVEKRGASLSLEIEERSIKLGGNMPIMANALGQIGITINCVGALGYPQLHPAFKSLPAGCHPYSFTDPGTATAFEFNDGKIMMAQMAELNLFGWDKIKEHIGIDTLISIFSQSDLISILNWSEIDASTGIWKGILKNVLSQYSVNGKNQIAFFDLSDCSKRSSESIKEMLKLLHQFSMHCKVVLSLNKNEAHIIYKTLYKKNSKKDFSGLGKKIFEKIGIAMLVLHSGKEVAVFTNDESINMDTFFIKSPKISTGAGDNFNAGFCAAQLLGLGLESTVIFANAVSGYYVRTGTSPSLQNIIDFLKNIQEPD